MTATSLRRCPLDLPTATPWVTASPRSTRCPNRCCQRASTLHSQARREILRIAHLACYSLFSWPYWWSIWSLRRSLRASSTRSSSCSRFRYPWVAPSWLWLGPDRRSTSSARLASSCWWAWSPKMASSSSSLATILGVLPIALSLGASAGSRQSLGIAVVGGLIGATLLSLYLVPALYSYLSRTTRSQGTDEPKLAEPEGALATQG